MFKTSLLGYSWAPVRAKPMVLRLAWGWAQLILWVLEARASLSFRLMLIATCAFYGQRSWDGEILEHEPWELVIQNAVWIPIGKFAYAFHIVAKTRFGQLKNLCSAAISSWIGHILNH